MQIMETDLSAYLHLILFNTFVSLVDKSTLLHSVLCYMLYESLA